MSGETREIVQAVAAIVFTSVMVVAVIVRRLIWVRRYRPLLTLLRKPQEPT